MLSNYIPLALALRWMANAPQMALQRYVCEWLNRMPRERDNCEVWSSQPGTAYSGLTERTRGLCAALNRPWQGWPKAQGCVLP